MSQDMRIDAHRVRTLREARGWSQEQLAAVSGLSARTVQRLEADGRASGESRMAVASALGMEPAELSVAGASLETPQPVSGQPMGQADRLKIVLWIVSLVMVWVMFALFFGHKLGAEAGARDNRINAACAADPASESCRR